ncbi:MULTISPECIES: hypothetical protein [unclassified Rhizobium]|uniref:hypothetical protein n=1 Tax=unclassified Rhizobium TaxID=2613769 RepID=UPI0006FCA06E|nr:MULTISPECIES: hypothetical protein [unclassified Rhizobium]KQV33151.1 hypothetical protein ASC86_18500 [Rhizobium sp. Root1212]KRD21611.1 hypothetical protein ASE37_19000 [Rhizobium sp. Root268]
MSVHTHMRDLRWGLSHSTYLYSPLVFDPIFTPLFTAVFGTAGIAIGTSTTITFASIASAIATTAVTMGLQMLLAPKPPKPEDGKAPKTQALPYRQWCVGRNRIAGAYMLWESKGKRLFSVQALAGHKISAVRGFWLHDDRVELEDIDADGRTLFDDDDRYGDNISIWWRYGQPTETAYPGITDYLSAEGIWTSNHRGDGQASVGMVCRSIDPEHQSERFPYGPPSISAEIDGAVCWDFRDPSQSPTNPSTWLWTRNPAIILAWHLCFSEFGERLDYTKAIFPVLDMWKEEADVCDERVSRAGGGDEARYECSGWDTTENSPKVAQNAILASCDGHLVCRGDGARILTVGKFRESRCAMLTDFDIVGHQVLYDVLFEDDTNRLIPKFTYPATAYATADTDYFEDTDAQLEAGRVLAQEAEYTWVQQWRQARRLGMREWRRLRQKVRGSLDVRLSGINAVYHRWVRLATPKRLPKLDGKVIENRRSVLAVTKGAFSMDFIAHPDNIDEWNPATDEGQAPPVPPNPNFENILAPVIDVVQAKQRNGTVYLRIVLLDPDDDSLTPVTRYRIADIDGLGTPGSWVEQQFSSAKPSGGVIELATNVVPSDELLDVQALFKASNKRGDWCPTTNVTSSADPTPPGVATSVSATGGVGQATFAWRAPNSPNYSGARLFWNTVNDFSTSSYQGPPEYGSPNGLDSRTLTSLPAGTLYGWVQTINRSGVAASAVATGSFTVT